MPTHFYSPLCTSIFMHMNTHSCLCTSIHTYVHTYTEGTGSEGHRNREAQCIHSTFSDFVGSSFGHSHSTSCQRQARDVWNSPSTQGRQGTPFLSALCQVTLDHDALLGDWLSMWTHPESSHTLPGLIVLIYGDNSDSPRVIEGLQLVFKQSQRDGMQEARVQAANLAFLKTASFHKKNQNLPEQ